MEIGYCCFVASFFLIGTLCDSGLNRRNMLHTMGLVKPCSTHTVLFMIIIMIVFSFTMITDFSVNVRSWVDIVMEFQKGDYKHKHENWS